MQCFFGFSFNLFGRVDSQLHLCNFIIEIKTLIFLDPIKSSAIHCIIVAVEGKVKSNSSEDRLYRFLPLLILQQVELCSVRVFIYVSFVRFFRISIYWPLGSPGIFNIPTFCWCITRTTQYLVEGNITLEQLYFDLL